MTAVRALVELAHDGAHLATRHRREIGIGVLAAAGFIGACWVYTAVGWVLLGGDIG